MMCCSLTHGAVSWVVKRFTAWQVHSITAKGFNRSRPKARVGVTFGALPGSQAILVVLGCITAQSELGGSTGWPV